MSNVKIYKDGKLIFGTEDSERGISPGARMYSFSEEIDARGVNAPNLTAQLKRVVDAQGEWVEISFSGRDILFDLAWFEKEKLDGYVEFDEIRVDTEPSQVWHMQDIDLLILKVRATSKLLDVFRR